MTVRIRAARPDEAAALSALALRSKAHWGYDAEFMRACAGELTFHPQELRPLRAHVAEGDRGTVLGFFTVAGEAPEGKLEHLYVDPRAIGSGAGRALLAAACNLARSEGFRFLFIDADPNAETFYLHHGAVRDGEVPSGSIPGRKLPRLRLDLR
jgi:GNAT superfamily N-acetyltransferase